jgi:hypothetical protein
MPADKARRALNARLKGYTQPPREVAVFMGDGAGVVAVPGRSGYIYVRDIRGNVSIVWNTSVPNIVNQPVFVAYLDGRLQVVRVRDVFFGSKPTNVGPHNWTHEWSASGGDVVRVFGMQMMPWKAEIDSADAFTVNIYRAIYDADGTWVVEGVEDIDLNAHIPGTSANGCYVLLSIDTSGVINHTVGSDVDPYTTLAVTDIPAIPTDEKPLWAIRLYYGQTTLSQTPQDNDFIDLRDSLHAAAGVGGGPSVATSAEIDTGTNNTKFASPLAISGSHNVPHVVPGTAGDVLMSDGTDWYSAAPGAGAGKATSAEVDTGTNDTKFATPLAISGSHNVPHVVPGTTGNYMRSDGTDWVSAAFPSIPVKATSAEIDTGTDDAKFATALAISGSHNVPHVIPGSDGNVLTSDGTDWVSEAPPAGAGPATGAEVDTGTNNAKFASPLALADSHYVPHASPATSGNVLASNGTDWVSTAPSGGTKATSAEVDTGTDDVKFVTPLAISGSHNVPHVVPGTTGNYMRSDGTDWVSAAFPSIPVKATSAEIDTGTDDAKFATALGIKDAHNIPSVVPSTSGNVLTSNGTDWISSTPAAVPVKATAAELDTGTDDVKFATALGIKNAHNIPNVVPSTSGNILTSNGTDWISSAPTGGGTVATGAELDTGTDNAKFASALALANSHYIPTVSPATSGNVLTSNGTDWVSSTPSGGTKASAAEVDTGTDDAKFVTPKSIADSHNVPNVVPSTAGKLMTSDGTDWISVAPANVLFIDQAGGTSDTYGVLGGTRNGSNKVFTVSQSAYNSGTLRVFLNGQMLTQGSAEDWVETAPGSGTFTFAVAPEATDEITAVYGYQAISGIISEAPIDGTPYARQDAGWVAGGGSGNAPGWVQDKFNGNSVSTVTLDTAPLVGHSLILFGNVYNTGAVSAVSSTNTTWTRVIGPYHPDQAYYDIWIGVCGTSPGSVITITHADAYASFQVIEISDVLTPTAGQTLTATGVSTGELTGVTVGHIVAVAAANDNSLTTVTIAPVEPGHLVTPDSARGVGVGYGPLYVVFASTSVVKCSVASETALLMVELS